MRPPRPSDPMSTAMQAMFADPDAKAPLLSSLESFESCGSLHADFTEEPSDLEEAEDGKERSSKGQHIKEGLRKRAKSIKESFSSKKKTSGSSSKTPSRKGSQSQFPPITHLGLTPVKAEFPVQKVSPPDYPPPDIPHRGRSPPLSPLSLRSSTSTPSPLKIPSFEPPTPPTMDFRQSTSSLLDTGASSRRQQMSEQKARTHSIAVNEEKGFRERMRKKGKEHLFPKYHFVDFIGKGTYGRVFQA